MPHGKQGRTSNKKKKARGNGNRPRGPIAARSPADAFDSNAFSEWASREGGSSKTLVDQFHSNLYSRYKKATMRFKEAVEAMVPSEVYCEGNTEQLMDAAEYIANDENVFLEPTFMQDLRLTLRVRKRVARSMEGGGDEGHAFFIEILEYCWKSLLVKWKRQRGILDNSKEAEDEKFANRFDALSIDDIDIEEDEKEYPTTEEISRPKTEKKELQKLTFTDILYGDDRAAAILFFDDVDAIMGISINQYVLLKRKMRANHESGAHPESIIPQLMETAVASNFAIQQVSMLEHVLAAEFPHFNTIFRVLGVVACPAVIQSIIKLLQDNSPMAAKMDVRKETVEFVGDALESGFRDYTDPNNKVKHLHKDFCFRWKLTEEPLKEKIDQMFHSLRLYVRLEAPVSEEKKLYDEWKKMKEKNQWLAKWKHLGGGRNIIKTLRLVQVYSNVVINTSPTEFATMGNGQQSFGLPWHEKDRPAKTITDDLDQFLLIEMMPVLVAMCRKGLLSRAMPREWELYPIFCHIRKWCNNPHPPISFTLAFCFQLILTSIYDVQGDNDVVTLQTTARLSWERYFGQLDWVEEKSRSSSTLNRKGWYKYLNNMQTLDSLRWPRIGLSCVEHIGESRQSNSTWNPMCAGTFLLYLTYFNGLENGSRMVDTFAQVRFVLHLYNALLQTKALEIGELKFLDFLHKEFANCRGVWGGGKVPEHGALVKHFLVSAGYGVKHAQSKCDEIRACLVGDRYTPYKGSLSSFRKGNQDRAEELSRSFKRVVLHDFREDAAILGEKQKQGEIFEYHGRLQETIKAMREDRNLVATNLVSVGEYLNGFLGGVFEELEWEDLVSDVSLEMTKELGWKEDDNVGRYAEMMVLARRILGIFDFKENPLEEEEVKTITAYFRSYFSDVPLDKVMWFTPPAEDDDEETEIDEGYNTTLPIATVATTVTRDISDKEEGEGAGRNDAADRKPPAVKSDPAEEDSKPAAAVETSPKEPTIQSK
jgi:hypothetical protein